MTDKNFLFDDNNESVKMPDIGYVGHRARLRDKFLNSGAKSLADYEMLELLLTFAIPRADVKPIAKHLLNKFGSLSSVIHANNREIESVSGVKETTLALIKTVEELLVRSLQDELRECPVLNNYDKLLDYCFASIGFKDIEQFRILYLDSKLQLIKDELVQEGTVNYATVYPREVVKRVLACGAVNIIIFHNHPTGDTTCSQADIDITNKIQLALASIDVVVLDHIIVGRGSKNYYSFKNRGTLKF